MLLWDLGLPSDPRVLALDRVLAHPTSLLPLGTCNFVPMEARVHSWPDLEGHLEEHIGLYFGREGWGP